MAVLGGRLEGAIEAVPAALVHAPERGLERVEVDRDPVSVESSQVDVLPRRVGAHEGLADVEEDGA
jgi:hypothetical protein